MMIFKVNYAILIIAVKNYNYDYSFFVWSDVMSKYKLLLDESGNFDSKNEKYIIIGGILFEQKYQEELEKVFIPLHEHLCCVLGCDELHASRNKKIFDYVAPVLGSSKYIQSIVFVIDKTECFIFKKYDKKSFKYNKAIQHLIRKMIEDNLISKEDELYIKIDNINLNEYENKNIETWLPNNVEVVKEVVQDDSKNIISLQLADIIVNNFSKKDICKKNSVRVKMLNPKIYCFLNQTINDYIIE